MEQKVPVAGFGELEGVCLLFILLKRCGVNKRCKEEKSKKYFVNDGLFPKNIRGDNPLLY